jgi:hypothetical protein
VQRFHLGADDTEWLPLPVRAAGSLYALMAFLGTATVVVGVFMLLYAIGIIWIGAIWLLAIPAAYGMRGRVARSAMRGRMRKLERSAVSLASSGERDQRLVRVSGRIRAQKRIPSFTQTGEVVFRRLVFRFHGLCAIEESAVDFLIDDGSGEPVLVLVDGARFLADDALEKDWKALPAPVIDALEQLDPPQAIRDGINDWRIDAARTGAISAAGRELVLRDGDTV